MIVSFDTFQTVIWQEQISYTTGPGGVLEKSQVVLEPKNLKFWLEILTWSRLNFEFSKKKINKNLELKSNLKSASAVSWDFRHLL